MNVEVIAVGDGMVYIHRAGCADIKSGSGWFIQINSPLLQMPTTHIWTLATQTSLDTLMKRSKFILACANPSPPTIGPSVNAHGPSWPDS
jgi:hypothetical protein